MVKIKRGDLTLTVTQGAYLHIYKALGYSIVEGKGGENPPALESVDSGIDYAALEEKPLSDMNFKELKDYAAHLGIDTTGMINKKEVRTAIIEYIRN